MTSSFRFDAASGRMVIGDHELHCGECFHLRYGDQWHEVRIEHGGGGWYLIGLPKGVPTHAENHEGRIARL